MSNPLESREDMTDELRRYVRDHNLPSFSADELACEISGVLDGEESAFIEPPADDARRQELSEAHAYLLRFCERWEAAID